MSNETARKQLQRVQSNNVARRAQIKFEIIQEKGLKKGLLATYRGKKERTIKKITSAGLILLEGARVPIDPADCELAP